MGYAVACILACGFMGFGNYPAAQVLALLAIAGAIYDRRAP